MQTIKQRMGGSCAMMSCDTAQNTRLPGSVVPTVVSSRVLSAEELCVNLGDDV
jgi:hypothetical protein